MSLLTTKYSGFWLYDPATTVTGSCASLMSCYASLNICVSCGLQDIVALWNLWNYDNHRVEE